MDEMEFKVLDRLSGKPIRAEDLQGAIQKELNEMGISDIHPGKVLHVAIKNGRIESVPGDKFRIK
jgi:hypothetical protein